MISFIDYEELNPKTHISDYLKTRSTTNSNVQSNDQSNQNATELLSTLSVRIISTPNSFNNSIGLSNNMSVYMNIRKMCKEIDEKYVNVKKFKLDNDKSLCHLINDESIQSFQFDIDEQTTSTISKHEHYNQLLHRFMYNVAALITNDKSVTVSSKGMLFISAITSMITTGKLFDVHYRSIFHMIDFTVRSCINFHSLSEQLDREVIDEVNRNKSIINNDKVNEILSEMNKHKSSFKILVMFMEILLEIYSGPLDDDNSFTNDLSSLLTVLIDMMHDFIDFDTSPIIMSTHDLYDVHNESLYVIHDCLVNDIIYRDANIIDLIDKQIDMEQDVLIDWYKWYDEYYDSCEEDMQNQFDRLDDISNSDILINRFDELVYTNQSPTNHANNVPISKERINKNKSRIRIKRSDVLFYCDTFQMSLQQAIYVDYDANEANNYV